MILKKYVGLSAFVVIPVRAFNVDGHEVILHCLNSTGGYMPLKLDMQKEDKIDFRRMEIWNGSDEVLCISKKKGRWRIMAGEHRLWHTKKEKEG